jgi:hypothetical protein
MSEVKVEKGTSPTMTTTRRTGWKPRGNQHSNQPVSKFEGRFPDLKGFTFDCAEGRHADSYNLSMMKEMALYMGRTFTYGSDLKWTIEHEDKLTVPKPRDIDIKTVSATEKCIWEKCFDEYVKRDVRLEENCEKLYSLIIGQCTEYMKSGGL